MIPVRCSACSQGVRVPDTMANQVVKCPKCGAGIQVSPADSLAIQPTERRSAPPPRPVPVPLDNSAMRQIQTPGDNRRLLLLVGGIGGGILVLLLAIFLTLLMGKRDAPAATSGVPAQSPGGAKTPAEAINPVPGTAPAPAPAPQPQMVEPRPRPAPIYVDPMLVSMSRTPPRFNKRLTVTTLPSKSGTLSAAAGKEFLVCELGEQINCEQMQFARVSINGDYVYPAYYGVLDTAVARPLEGVPQTGFLTIHECLGQPCKAIAFHVPANRGALLVSMYQGSPLSINAVGFEARPRPQPQPQAQAQPPAQPQVADIPFKTVAAGFQIEQIVGIAEGHRLVLRESNNSSLRIFDPQTDSFSTISIPTDKFLAATGGNRIVVYLTDSDSFRVYDAPTAKEFARFDNPLKKPLTCITMGCQTPDRFFVSYVPHKNDNAKIPPLDAAILRTDGGIMQQMSISRSESGDAPWTLQRATRAAPDLTCVVSSNNVARIEQGWEPTQIGTRDGSITPISGSALVETRVNASRVFALEDRSMKSSDATYFPVAGYDLVLSLGSLKRSKQLSLRTATSDNDLFVFGSIPGWESNLKQPLDLDLCISYEPVSGHLLVVMPDRKTILHAIQPLAAKCKENGVKCIALRPGSPPPAVRGEKWSHRVNAAATEGAPQFAVEKGPEGLQVAPDGSLSWQVPAKAAVVQKVILSVTAGGQTRTFPLLIQPVQRTPKGIAAVDRLPGMGANDEYVALGGDIFRVAVADDGRVAVCAIPGREQLVVVDLAQAREIAAVPWRCAATEGAPFAAGGNRVVVYDQGANDLRLYDLRSGKLEKSIRNPFTQAVCDMVMGMKDGSAVFCAASKDRQKSDIDVLELPSGRRLNISITDRDRIVGYRLQLTAADDLSIVTALRPDTSPAGAILMQKSGNAYTLSYEHSDFGVLYPMLGSELACNGRSLKFDLKTSFAYAGEGQTRNGPSLRPIKGSQLLLGVCGNKVALYTRGKATPIKTLARIPGAEENFSVLRNRRMMYGNELAFLNGATGIGYVVPTFYPGLVIISSAVDTDGPPIIADANTLKVIRGRRFTFKATEVGEAKGTAWSLGEKPPGASIGADGTLTWDVPEDYTGGNIEIIATNKSGSDRRSIRLVPASCELADKETWAAGSGLLVVGTEVRMACAPAAKYAALAQGNLLYSFDAKTLRPLNQAELPGIAEVLSQKGDEVYVVVPRKLLVYALPELKQKRAFDLPLDKASDICIHPSQAVCWIAGHETGQPDGIRSRRIAQVSEAANKAQLLAKVFGRMVAISPDGGSLYVGIKEIFSDSAVLVDQWGQAYTFTNTESLDLLVKYNIAAGFNKPDQVHENPGGNMRRVVVSPDGRHVSPVAGGGYRAGGPDQNGYTIPALQANSIKKCDVAYKTDAYPFSIAYHPSLDLVVAGNEHNVFVFNRSTGQVRGADIATANGFSEVSNVYFAGDLTCVWLLGKRQDGFVLMSVPLGLSEQEKNKAGAVVKVAPTAAKVPDAGIRIGPKPEAIKVTRAQLKALAGRDVAGKMTPKDIAAKYQDSVVLIAHDDGSGTGFLISDDGFIATCAHVLPDNGEGVKVQLQDPVRKTAATVDATVVAADRELDLALLKVAPGFQTPYLCFETRRRPTMGEDVSIIGNPGLGDKVLTKTMTQGIVSNPDRKIDEQSFIQTNAAVNPGTSGSPMFNDAGNVIGLVTLKGNIEAVGFAVPGERIIKYLEQCCSDKKPVNGK